MEANVINIPRQILQNVQLQEDIAREGFAVTPLLSPEELQALERIVYSQNDDTDINLEDTQIKTSFRLSAFHNDPAYRERVHQNIFALLKDKIEDLLYDYEPLVINIIDKPAGAGSIAIHQNPSFAEEPIYKSVSVWIPLVNANKENGTLGILRGSHDVFDGIRAPNMPNVFEPVADLLIHHYFEPLNVHKGQAVILDDSLVHWSYPNESQERRAAVQLIMVPRGIPHIYYYYNTSETAPKVELFEVNKTFFYDFNYQSRPSHLPKMGEIPFTYHTFDEAEMLRRVAPKNPDIYKRRPKKSWLARLLNWN